MADDYIDPEGLKNAAYRAAVLRRLGRNVRSLNNDHTMPVATEAALNRSVARQRLLNAHDPTYLRQRMLGGSPSVNPAAAAQAAPNPLANARARGMAGTTQAEIGGQVDRETAARIQEKFNEARKSMAQNRAAITAAREAFNAQSPDVKLDEAQFRRVRGAQKMQEARQRNLERAFARGTLSPRLAAMEMARGNLPDIPRFMAQPYLDAQAQQASPDKQAMANYYNSQAIAAAVDKGMSLEDATKMFGPKAPEPRRGYMAPPGSPAANPLFSAGMPDYAAAARNQGAAAAGGGPMQTFASDEKMNVPPNGIVRGGVVARHPAAYHNYPLGGTYGPMIDWWRRHVSRGARTVGIDPALLPDNMIFGQVPDR